MTRRFQQTNELWLSIQDEKSPDIKRLKMIEMAKLLLRFASFNEDDLKSLSGSETLTDFFLEYQEIAESTGNFFKTALPHIEEELAGGDFQAEIEVMKNELFEITEKYKNFKNDYTYLLDQKSQLIETSEKFQSLETEINELKQIEENTRPENMSALSQEIEQLKQQIEKDRPEYEKLINEKKDLDDLLQNIKNLTDSFADENNLDEMIKYSRQLSNLLDGEWDSCDEHLAQELRKLKQRNKMYLEILGKMDECLSNLKQTTECEKVNKEIYDKHFFENNELIDNFNGSQIKCEKSIGQRIDRINELSSQIKGSLEAFDDEITKAISDSEEIIHNIRRFNKTSL